MENHEPNNNVKNGLQATQEKNLVNKNDNVTNTTLELQNYDVPPGKERQQLVQREDLENYIKTMSETSGFKEQYHMLKCGKQQPCEAGSKAENKIKNRYADLLPYDETRVVLQSVKDDPSSDYINANYVDGYNKPKAYICTQGPIEKTVPDFWRMIWQEHVCKILMTANIIEHGKKRCEKYWPESTTKYGEITVTLLSELVLLDYTVRTLRLHKVGKSCRRVVRQYQFTGWPDHSVPPYRLSLSYMLKSARNFMPNSKAPIVLHCSAGVGRSGTVMLLDSALDMIRAEGKVDVFGILYRMRQQRVNLVETVEQYKFVHETIVDTLCGDVPCVSAPSLVTYYVQLRVPDAGQSKTKIQLQYEKLSTLTSTLTADRCIAAISPDNKPKNRSPDILAPDYGRPILKRTNSCNYINAVYVNTFGREQAFIATQFPLPDTVKDFWQMVYETDSRTIVVLNDVLKNDESSPPFWPSSGNLYHGSLRLDHVTTEENQNIAVWKFKLRNVDESKKSRSIRIFQIMGWSRNDLAPPSVVGIVRLLLKVDRWQHKSGVTHPTVVTCYNGVTGCGLYCSAAYMAEQIHREKEVDVFTAVRTVRHHRPAFLPKDQYRWLYDIGCSLTSENKTS